MGKVQSNCSNIYMDIVRASLFIIASISISSASLFVLLSNASAPACAFWRLLFSSLLIVIYVLISGKNLVFQIKYLLMISFSGFSLGLHFALWMDSLFRVPVAVSTAIVVTYPIYALLIEVLLGHEKADIYRVLGMILAFSGVLIYFHQSLFIGVLSFIGVFESFLGALFVTIYFYIGRIIRRELDIYSYVIPTYIIGAMTVLGYSIILRDNVLIYVSGSWIWFLALAIVPMIGGHTVMNYLLRFYRSSTVTSIAFIEPIGASILVYVFIGQMPGILHLVIVPIIIAGVMLTIISEE